MHTALQGTWHSLNLTDTFFVMQKKTKYTAASKYIQCFQLQYYEVFDLSRADKVIRVIEGKII